MGFAACVVLVWTVQGWLLYGLVTAVILVLVAFFVFVQRMENRTWTLEVRGDGIRLVDELVPWDSVRQFRGETLVVLGLLKQPMMEIAALIIERDGHDVGYPIRADVEEIRALALRLESYRQRASKPDAQTRKVENLVGGVSDP